MKSAPPARRPTATDQGSERRSRNLVRYLLAGMVLLAMLGEATFLFRQRSAATPIGGPFALVDETGRRVTQADLLGKPTVLFFGFTACPEVCPTTLMMLADAMKKLGPKADKLNVVFVSVDPSNDTPEQLKGYLSSFDPRIHGFTGTEGEVASMAKAYHVRYRRIDLSGGGYTLEHTAAIFLFDAAGKSVGVIPYGQDEKWVLRSLAKLTD